MCAAWPEAQIIVCFHQTRAKSLAQRHPFSLQHCTALALVRITPDSVRDRLSAYCLVSFSLTINHSQDLLPVFNQCVYKPCRLLFAYRYVPDVKCVDPFSTSALKASSRPLTPLVGTPTSGGRSPIPANNAAAKWAAAFIKPGLPNRFVVCQSKIAHTF